MQPGARRQQRVIGIFRMSWEEAEKSASPWMLMLYSQALIKQCKKLISMCIRSVLAGVPSMNLKGYFDFEGAVS